MTEREFGGDNPKILWAGERGVVVAKRSGELVHNSHFAGPQELSLRQRLGRALGRRVFPVHRLDRGTSGAILFSLESEWTDDWQSALAAGTKDYLAIVRGRMRDGAVVKRPVRDESGTEREALSVIAPIAVSSVERVTLVGIRLWTGRHHQARRHCVHLRHPIVGDSTHGDTKFNRAFRASTGLARLGLHAMTLEFLDPVGPRVVVSCRPPGELTDAIDALFGLDLTDEVPDIGPVVSALVEAEDQKGLQAGDDKF